MHVDISDKSRSLSRNVFPDQGVSLTTSMSHLKPFVHILFKKSSAFFECFSNYSRFVKIKDTIGSVGTVSVELELYFDFATVQ